MPINVKGYKLKKNPPNHQANKAQPKAKEKKNKQKKYPNQPNKKTSKQQKTNKKIKEKQQKTQTNPLKLSLHFPSSEIPKHRSATRFPNCTDSLS